MRRTFLKGLALGCVAWRDALGAEAPGEMSRQVASVEVVRVEGRREVREAHRQDQAHPSHVWGPPAEYHEPDDAPARVVPQSALYLRLRTEGGQDALYGPDRSGVRPRPPARPRALPPRARPARGRGVVGPDAPFEPARRRRPLHDGDLRGRQRAAGLRGRMLGLPVFRLLGGSRYRVPATRAASASRSRRRSRGPGERAPGRGLARADGSSPTGRRRGARAS